MGTLRYIVRRLLFSFVMVLGVSAIIFFLVNAIGNPIEILLAERPGITPESIEEISKYYGLDKDVFTRYWIWLGNILVLDLGTSIIYNQPVRGLLFDWGLETLKIQVPAILLAVVFAIVMAVAKKDLDRREVRVGVHVMPPRVMVSDCDVGAGDA